MDFNGFVARNALASFTAYLFGQILDVTVFNALRTSKVWWVAPSVSTICGNALDTLVFFGVAFYESSDPFMAANWVEIAIVDCVFKISISIAVFLSELLGIRRAAESASPCLYVSQSIENPDDSAVYCLHIEETANCTEMDRSIRLGRGSVASEVEKHIRRR